MTTPALEVEELSVWGASSATRLAEGISFDVACGEILGVVGETGAGKSIIMKALLGLLPRGLEASGHAQLNGQGWLSVGDSRNMRSLLGRDATIISQNPGAMLDPVVRIGAQLIEGPTYLRMMSRREATERAVELLRLLSFDEPEEILGLYPHQLSGGMAQRASIAMMMMPRPTLLVADEPTSALDAHIRFEVLSLLRAAATTEGSCVVLVSHDLGLVGRFADRIVVIYAGHAIEQGGAREVLRQPRHPYTAALLQCTPSLESRRQAHLAAIEGAQPSGAWPHGCVFEPRCPLADDRCRRERPMLVRHEGRDVACHRPLDAAELPTRQRLPVA